MTNYKLLFIVVGVICLFAAVLGYFARFAGPVLYSYRDRASASQGPTFILFNPLRDRSPERVVEQFLEQLKTGDCAKAVSRLPIQLDKQLTMCEKEGQAALDAWTLKDRSESDGVVTLHYALRREGFEGFGGDSFFQIQEFSGDWRIIGVNFVY
jgi:hypothetical protein